MFMDSPESEFLKSMEFNPLVWYCYIWTHGEEKVKSVLDKLNKYQPNIKFTHEFNKESIPIFPFSTF